MALEGFQIARALAGRAGTASSARGTLGILGAEVPQMGPIAGAEVHVALCYYPEGTAVARYDLALYDTAVYADPSPPCVDISCDVVSVSITAGRDAPLARFRTATCALVVNDPDGIYSPWRTAATPDKYATIRPGIDVEIWVTVAGVDYPRFAGQVGPITDLFPDTTGAHQVQFDCADYLNLLAAYDGLEVAPVGAGETSGARLNRIANNAGVTRPRAFDAGTIALQATTLAKNALDEAGMVCDTELGALWCDPAGTLVHRDRNGMITDPHYTSVQATFGEITPELCYRDVQLVTDTTKIENVVSIANEGGTAVTLVDSASVSLYGARTHRRLDLIHVDPAQSTVIAQRHLDFYAYAASRIETLTPAVTLESLPALLALGLLWRIQLRRRAEGFQVIADLQIQAIRERITSTTWDLELDTFSAGAVFDPGHYAGAGSVVGVSEPFDKADGTTIGPVLSWSKTSFASGGTAGGVIAGNAFAVVGNPVGDKFAQCKITTAAPGVLTGTETMVVQSTVTAKSTFGTGAGQVDYSRFVIHFERVAFQVDNNGGGGADRARIFETGGVASAFVPVTFGVGDVLRLEVSGALGAVIAVGKINGATVVTLPLFVAALPAGTVGLELEVSCASQATFTAGTLDKLDAFSAFVGVGVTVDPSDAYDTALYAY